MPAPARQPLLAGYDPAAIIGLVLLIALIGAAIVLGGAAASFVDPAALLIVFGGTLAGTIMSFPGHKLAAAPRLMLKALSIFAQPETSRVARQCLEAARRIRGSGVIGYEHEIGRQEGRPILQRGLIMLADGVPNASVVAALRQEVFALHEQRESAHRVLRRAASLAPAMGLIGTLVGLVQMLGRLDDPSAIGPGMAVALLTTLYGAILGHAVLGPLAERLAVEAETELQHSELQLIAVQSIIEQENPRVLETRLNGLLPASARLAMFD